MKMKTMIATALVIISAGCASGPKNEEIKAGVADCAMMCKANQEIKEYSQSLGGGFMLLFFGGEEKSALAIGSFRHRPKLSFVKTQKARGLSS